MATIFQKVVLYDFHYLSHKNILDIFLVSKFQQLHKHEK